MSKLLKVLIALSISSASISLAYSEQPVPVICPPTITCTYNGGCSDVGSWYVDGQGKLPFQGEKTFSLFQIDASIATPSNKTYWFYCSYGQAADRLKLVYSSCRLVGSWTYSGFNSARATCNSINPLDCTGLSSHSF